MGEDAKAVRKAVLEYIRLLARASQQLQYEKNVAAANVPDELICMFCDDLFHPKTPAFLRAFTEGEIKDLAEFYGILCMASRKMKKSSHSLRVADLHKLSEWRSAMAFAKELETRFGPVGP
jgi:hypothetical protein